MKTLFRQLGALVRLSFLELWRRNDVFALVILALAVMAPLAMANPFGAAGASRYLDEVALLLIWAFSIFVALGTGSRLFPPEFESRTIYPLLAKPISCGRLLVGKYLGAAAATASVVTLFYALFALSVWMRGGTLGIEFLEAFVLHLACVALAVAAALLGSLLLTRSAALTIVGIALTAMFFFGRNLLAYASSVSAPVAALLKAVYVVGPHVEFFDMRQRLIHGWGAVDGWVLVVVLGYAAAYVTVLLLLSAWALKRKKL